MIEVGDLVRSKTIMNTMPEVTYGLVLDIQYRLDDPEGLGAPLAVRVSWVGKERWKSGWEEPRRLEVVNESR